jgi:hypothetical protein
LIASWKIPPNRSVLTTCPAVKNSEKVLEVTVEQSKKVKISGWVIRDGEIEQPSGNQTDGLVNMMSRAPETQRVVRGFKNVRHWV